MTTHGHFSTERPILAKCILEAGAAVNAHWQAGDGTAVNLSPVPYTMLSDLTEAPTANAFYLRFREQETSIIKSYWI